MQIYKIYKGSNLPNTFLVLRKDAVPETTVPFNLLYLFGDLSLTKGAVKPSYLPFSKGSRIKLVESVDEHGYCFYKWPGKVLGPTLGDLLESEGLVIALDASEEALPGSGPESDKADTRPANRDLPARLPDPPPGHADADKKTKDSGGTGH